MSHTPSLEQLEARRKSLGSLGALDLLIEIEKRKSSSSRAYPISYEPFNCIEIEVDKDLEKYKKRPKNLPGELQLPPLKGLGNDYSFLEHQRLAAPEQAGVKLSVVVLTFNRAVPLSLTLAALVNQTYPKNLFEVIVTDDGGTEDTHAVVRQFADKLDIKYVWHRDVGFTPAAARNNGVALTRNPFVVLLDVDMMPSKGLLRAYASYANVIDRCVLIGPRRYIDPSNLSVSRILDNPDIEATFEDIATNNDVANKISGDISVDWRLEIFAKTQNLKTEKLPFRVFASGNVAFSKTNFNAVGCFEERFKAWGFEDTELGFRFFNDGKYFIPVLDALAFHQEPPDGRNETDRAAGKAVSGELFGQLCPYYRRLTSRKSDFEVPSVSIYIPAYNAEKTICDAIDSALNQTFKDLEVVICDDGSTDQTASLLERYFSANPRVRWVRQENGGIGKASNAAVRLARGIYVGQLDSDDYLARDVVEKCVSELQRDTSIGMVYTSYENEFPDGRREPGYNYPVFTREKLITAMIAHHFRIFRKLYWSRTQGFNDRIKNAVDYDMYLKLSETCEFKHLNVRGYRRRLHGGNTSLVDSHEQIRNTAKVASACLRRMQIPYVANLESSTSTALCFEKVA